MVLRIDERKCPTFYHLRHTYLEIYIIVHYSAIRRSGEIMQISKVYTIRRWGGQHLSLGLPDSKPRDSYPADYIIYHA